MSNDPAVDAAQRALDRMFSEGRVARALNNQVKDGALNGAREAFEHVQKLHTPDEGHNPECHCGIPANAYRNCKECGTPWPCATARLIYPEAKL